MAFDLHVQFSGPCLFVLHTNPSGATEEVTVLMPDGRRLSHPDPKHPDNKPAVHHVGFVRLDLADMWAAFPKAAEEAQPRYELVHRFSGQVLKFGDGLEPEPIAGLSKLLFPDFDQIAPRGKAFELDLHDGLLGDTPPSQLLMRTVLRGGSFESTPKTVWKFSPALNPGGGEYKGEFASTVTWKRRIDQDHLTVAVTGFGEKDPEAEFHLGPFPEGEVVTLVVGNLCGHNPLEWDDLLPPPLPPKDDDFKWLYHLLRTKGKPTLEFPQGELPAPILVPQGGDDETGDEACMGGKITVSTP